MIEIVDTEGVVVDLKKRSEVHGNPSLLHKVVHVLVFNCTGELLLQKRSVKKDTQPGKWDTSVGGHILPAEDLEAAAHREMEEELGIVCNDMEPLYSYIYYGKDESELVFTYRCFHVGPFCFNLEEIDEVAFWQIEDIKEALGRGILSDNFEFGIKKYFLSIHNDFQ